MALGQRLLVPLDGSALAAQALPYATDLVRKWWLSRIFGDDGQS
jgi:hypothetical protein